MSTKSISPDDPRLTTYALGEMDTSERQEFERLLAAQPESQAWLDEIRGVAESLESSLRDEPEPASTLAPQLVLAQGRESHRPALLRFPQLYFVVSGLAAACFAIIVVIRDRQIVRTESQKSVLADMEHPVAPKGVAGLPVPAADDSGNVEIANGQPASEDTFFPVADAATSTFPLHVGRDSYEAVRHALMRGQRPTPASVRVAEMINAFSYSWPAPKVGEPFASVLEESSAPWNTAHRLVRIGLQGSGPVSVRLADDARVEVLFNAQRVAAWRLIGFDGGRPSLGVTGTEGEPLFGGWSMTVLYELVPIGAVSGNAGPDLLTVALRYRAPNSEVLATASWSLEAGNRRFQEASADMKFAAAVAAFGIGLRGTDPGVALAPVTIADWASSSAGQPERAEFLGLMRASESMRR